MLTSHGVHATYMFILIENAYISLGYLLGLGVDKVSKRRSAKRQPVTMTLPAYMIEDLDEISTATDLSRSSVLEQLLAYCFDHEEDIINELFPYEEEGEEEEEIEEEDEED